MATSIRLGLLAPAILASPYAQRGPIDCTVHDHTSILVTVKNRFGLPTFLTQRDAAAANFEVSLSLPAPRSDAPAMLQRGARALAAGNEPIWPRQFNDFQQDMMDFSAKISQDPAANPSVHAAAARLHNRKDSV
jgi:phospholipase C